MRHRRYIGAEPVNIDRINRYRQHWAVASAAKPEDVFRVDFGIIGKQKRMDNPFGPYGPAEKGHDHACIALSYGHSKRLAGEAPYFFYNHNVWGRYSKNAFLYKRKDDPKTGEPVYCFYRYTEMPDFGEGEGGRTYSHTVGLEIRGPRWNRNFIPFAISLLFTTHEHNDDILKNVQDYDMRMEDRELGVGHLGFPEKYWVQRRIDVTDSMLFPYSALNKYLAFRRAREVDSFIERMGLERPQGKRFPGDLEAQFHQVYKRTPMYGAEKIKQFIQGMHLNNWEAEHVTFAGNFDVERTPPGAQGHKADPMIIWEPESGSLKTHSSMNTALAHAMPCDI